MVPQKILFVDDDSHLLAAFQRNLRKQFTFDLALGGGEALALIEASGPYAVVVADMQMPAMNGVELLAKVREIAPDTVRVMLTGNADQGTATEAINRGQIFGFLNKPCDPETLRRMLEAALKQNTIATVERDLLEGTLTGSVRVLGEVLSMIDPASFGRGQRLRDSMRVFARFLGVSTTWHYEVAALLADIGLVSLPRRLLHKIEHGMELSTAERELAENSPRVGHDLLVNIPRLEQVAKIVLYQAKHYSGAGFPAEKISGEDIPQGSRMLKLLNDRAILEGEGIVKKQAYATMKGRGYVYDPVLLEACFRCFGDFLESALSADRTVTTVKVRGLRPGQVLVSDVKTTGGVLLVAAGNRLSEIMISRLNNYASFDTLKEPFYVQ